jgi:hypothetical protein
VRGPTRKSRHPEEGARQAVGGGCARGGWRPRGRQATMEGRPASVERKTEREREEKGAGRETGRDV